MDQSRDKLLNVMECDQQVVASLSCAVDSGQGSRENRSGRKKNPHIVGEVCDSGACGPMTVIWFMRAL